jgi:hypothetical protein
MTAIFTGLRKAQGYACIVDPVTGTRETDTFTCNHCQKVVAVKPGASPTDLGGYCGGCSKMICPKCVGKGCTPWEKIMDAMERDYERRRSYGLTA